MFDNTKDSELGSSELECKMILEALRNSKKAEG